MVKLPSWLRPKDVPLRMGPLVLHIGPYGDVLRTSERFSGVLRTSSGRNFAEWDNFQLRRTWNRRKDILINVSFSGLFLSLVY